MKNIYIFILSLLFSTNIFAQNTENQLDKDTPPKKDKASNKVKIRTRSGSIRSPYEFRPRIFVGGGLLKTFGEVRDIVEPGVHWIGNRYGFDAGLSVNLSNNFDLSFSYMKGSINGNENTSGLHRNFENKFSNLSLLVTYNFRNILGKQTMFYPYITTGLAFMQYKVGQDLKAANDSAYYYWPDGIIRDQPQGSDSDKRSRLDRDYNYETKVSSSSQTALAIPFGGGIGFNLSKKVTLKLGTQYFFSFSKDLDADNVNVANGQSSERKGNDGYLYTYANISYNFLPFREKPDLRNAPPVYFADFGFMNTDDVDGDGVIDLYDKCLGTPKLLAVDGYGCPLDDDKDGIPNYLDKEVRTSKMFVTDLSGKAIDQSKIDRKDTMSLVRSEVTEEFIMTPVGTTKPANYTVHVGTYGRNMPNRLMAKLNSIEGLIETKINDSLTVYTIGNYNDFKQAEAKQVQLVEAGYDQAFGVNEKKLTSVSKDLNTLANKPSEFTDNRRELLEAAERDKNKPKEDKLLFKVELTEYRLRIGLEKLATIIAKYGVEMHTTTGGLKKYTLGGFETPSEAELLRTEVIKVGLKEAVVAAYYNDTFIDMNQALEILKKKKSK